MQALGIYAFMTETGELIGRQPSSVLIGLNNFDCFDTTNFANWLKIFTCLVVLLRMQFVENEKCGNTCLFDLQDKEPVCNRGDQNVGYSERPC